MIYTFTETQAQKLFITCSNFTPLPSEKWNQGRQSQVVRKLQRALYFSGRRKGYPVHIDLSPTQADAAYIAVRDYRYSKSKALLQILSKSKEMSLDEWERSGPGFRPLFVRI